MRWRGRFSLILAFVLLGLFGGQWLVTYLEGSWWTATLSSGALTAYSRQTVLGIALEVVTISLGFAWWVWHFRFIVHAAAEINPDAQHGSPQFRQMVQGFESRPWALLLCIVLAVLLGSGLSNWTDMVLLAWEGVRFGVADPALGYDAGFYVARLPLLLKTHALATILVVGTLGVCLLVHLLVGSVRVGRGATAIVAPARRQLGLLAAALAALLAAHQVLLPLQLAAGIPHPVAPDLVQLYRSVSFVLVGVALAVVALSVMWAWRPIHSLVGGAWLALTLALVTTWWMSPSGEGWPEDEADRATQARFESLAFDVPPEMPMPHALAGVSSSRISLWDGDILGALETGSPVSDTPGSPRSSTGETRAEWVGVRPLPGGGTTLRMVRGDTADAFGRPVLSWSRTLPPSSTYPGASGIVSFEGETGVPLGGFIKRLALAWSLQSWSILGERGNALHADWDRDPVIRLSRLASIAVWNKPQLVHIDDVPTWVANGVLVSEAFPATKRYSFAGRRVAYARPGLVGLVDALTGETSIFLAPDADSLARAISRIWSGLIQPASAIPEEVHDRLAYPAELFTLHATMWVRQEATRLGVDTSMVSHLEPTPGWGTGPGSRQVAVVDRRSARILGILEGTREPRGGAGGGGGGGRGNRLSVYRADSVGLEAPDVLARRWQRLPEVQLLSDSVTARGGSFLPALVRYAGTGEGLIAYQPLLALGPEEGEEEEEEEVRVVGVAVAWRNHIGLGRTFTDAWRRISADGDVVRPGPGESEDLFEARRWMRVADSALARGDLVTFGRAFAALRRVLEGETPPPPDRP